MATVVPVTVDGVEFLVEVRESRGGAETVGLEDKFNLDGVRQTIEAMAAQLEKAWTKVQPSEATVEFGLDLTVKSGKLVGMIVEGGAAASMKITMTWKATTSDKADR